MIPKSWVAPKEIRELRNITRHRASLVKMRIQIKNEIHAFLEKKRIKAVKKKKKELSNLFGKKGMEFLDSLELNSTDSAILSSQLEVLKTLNREIDKVTNYIGCIVKRNREARLLMTIPGISYYGALLIVSEIGDVHRFSAQKKLCSWAGIVTSVYNSGNTQRHGRITKQGSKWLRWILIQCTHITVRYPGNLQDFYLRLMRKKGKKVAIVAAARKLLTVIYWMLLRGEEYRGVRAIDYKFKRLERCADTNFHFDLKEFGEELEKIINLSTQYLGYLD